MQASDHAAGTRSSSAQAVRRPRATWEAHPDQQQHRRPHSDGCNVGTPGLPAGGGFPLDHDGCRWLRARAALRHGISFVQQWPRRRGESGRWGDGGCHLSAPTIGVAGAPQEALSLSRRGFELIRRTAVRRGKRHRPCRGDLSVSMLTLR